MKILLLGSGGREHALAWKIAQSPLTDQLFIAPGNAGTEHTGQNVPLDPNDFSAVGEFVTSHHVDMVVVGPENPLVGGIADYFQNQAELRHVPVIGPSKAGARLEALDATCYRIELTRNVHNVDVAGVRTLRSARMVKLLRLAGHAPIPEPIDFDDDTQTGGRGY